MMTRHETRPDEADVWSRLAAPLPPGVIAWRQDGKPVSRDGRHIARFVAYIDANTVRERLESVVPGEWDLTLELLPVYLASGDDDAPAGCAFKARLQILGVIREDVGSGKDYKQAATDAFKRVAVRFGIGHELYDYEQNWVQMDGDGKYARPIEDPAVAYARRYGRSNGTTNGATKGATNGATNGTTSGANGADVKSATAGMRDTRPATRPEATSETPASQQGASASPARAPATPASTAGAASGTASPTLPDDEQSCPKCGGRTWDNRLTKRNPKAPDWKCRDRSCDGVIWPPRQAKANDESVEDEEIPF